MNNNEKFNDYYIFNYIFYELRNSEPFHILLKRSEDEQSSQLLGKYLDYFIKYIHDIIDYSDYFDVCIYNNSALTNMNLENLENCEITAYRDAKKYFCNIKEKNAKQYLKKNIRFNISENEAFMIPVHLDRKYSLNDEMTFYEYPSLLNFYKEDKNIFTINLSTGEIWEDRRKSEVKMHIKEYNKKTKKREELITELNELIKNEKINLSEEKFPSTYYRKLSEEIYYRLNSKFWDQNKKMEMLEGLKSNIINVKNKPNYKTVKSIDYTYPLENRIYTFNSLFKEINMYKNYVKKILYRIDDKEILCNLNRYLDQYKIYIDNIIDNSDFFYTENINDNEIFDRENEYYKKTFKHEYIDFINTNTEALILHNIDLFEIKTKESKEKLKQHLKFNISNLNRVGMMINLNKSYIANDIMMNKDDYIGFITKQEHLVNLNRSDGYIFDLRPPKVIKKELSEFRK